MSVCVDEAFCGCCIYTSTLFAHVRRYLFFRRLELLWIIVYLQPLMYVANLSESLFSAKEVW